MPERLSSATSKSESIFLEVYIFEPIEESGYPQVGKCMKNSRSACVLPNLTSQHVPGNRTSKQQRHHYKMLV